MAQSFQSGEKEIWESTVEGRISLSVLNSRQRPQTISIVGKGQRLRITTEERVLIEEEIRHSQNNPFTNGSLIRLGRTDPTQASPDELSDDDLAAIFELKGGEGGDFEDAVRVLSQVNVRRLKSMTGKKDAAKSQVEFLDEHIQQRWPIGGDTASNAEARGDRTVVVGDS